VPKNKLKIGILETGRLPDELQLIHGDYPSMFVSWLAPFDADIHIFAALDGVLPDSPQDCDLWVVTGSRFGAYEDHAWIASLEEFIRACRDAGQKMVGICFGHQIIAQAMGGTVEKSDKGWGLGVHDYSLSGWPGGTDPDGLRIQAFHQDQVVAAPPDAVQIARSDFCEFAGLWYPGFALTVQGHPEFSADYARDLMESRRGSVLTDADVDAALPNTDTKTTSEALAVFIRDHLAAI